MPRNYYIASIFDSDTEYSARPFPDSNLANRPWLIKQNYRFLPNAPMVAKETLLAQCLKKGIQPSLLQSVVYNQNTNIRQAIKSIRDSKRLLIESESKLKSGPLDRKQLIGKLISVEIEYYPTVKLKNSILVDVHHDGSLDDGGGRGCSSNVDF